MEEKTTQRMKEDKEGEQFRKLQKSFLHMRNRENPGETGRTQETRTHRQGKVDTTSTTRPKNG